VRRADNLSIFMCRLSRNSGASTSWNPKGLSRPVAGKLYLYTIRLAQVMCSTYTPPSLLVLATHLVYSFLLTRHTKCTPTFRPAGIAQSVLRLVTGWSVWGLNRGRGKPGPETHPSSTHSRKECGRSRGV
jgi:hypothetical protein